MSKICFCDMSYLPLYEMSFRQLCNFAIYLIYHYMRCLLDSYATYLLDLQIRHLLGVWQTSFQDVLSVFIRHLRNIFKMSFCRLGYLLYARGYKVTLSVGNNRKWVFKCVQYTKSTLLKYWRYCTVLYLIGWNPS